MPVNEMSPFLLLGDTGEGRAEDLEGIVAEFEREARRRVTEEQLAAPFNRAWRDAWDPLPSREVLAAELESRNPWVRAAARRILEAAGPDPGAGGEER